MDTFELQVLALSAPTMDLTSIQGAVDSLKDDLDTILEAQVPEFEAPCAEPAKDTVLATLFSTTTVPPPPS